MISCASRARTATAVLCLAAAALAACTSDGGDPAPSGAASSPTTSATSSAPSSSAVPSSSPPAGLGALAGAYLVVGKDADSADLYRVARGGALQRVTRTGDVTAVSADDGTVIVGRDTGGRETVGQLRGTAVRDLGLGEAFGPALSDDGALAWVKLGPSKPAGGISKPGGFVVSLRTSPTGATRTLATYPGSVGTVAWAGDVLVVPVAQGPDARVVALTTAGRSRTVATVPAAEDLVVTAGDDHATVQTSGGAVIVGLTDRSRHALPAGWTPLCWPDDDELLATRGGVLASIAVSDAGVAGTPRTLGRVPAGTDAFAGSCS